MSKETMSKMLTARLLIIALVLLMQLIVVYAYISSIGGLCVGRYKPSVAKLEEEEFCRGEEEAGGCRRRRPARGVREEPVRGKEEAGSCAGGPSGEHGVR